MPQRPPGNRRARAMPLPTTPQGLPQRPGEVGAKCGTCRQAGVSARTVQQEHGTHQIKIAANITRSGSDKERGVNPNLPLHYRMPHHHAGTQRISVTSKLVRPLRTRQQLPDSPLAAIHQLTAHKNNTQQWCRPVMIRFRGQIRGPQLRNTIKVYAASKALHNYSANSPSTSAPMSQVIGNRSSGSTCYAGTTGSCLYRRKNGEWPSDRLTHMRNPVKTSRSQSHQKLPGYIPVYFRIAVFILWLKRST